MRRILNHAERCGEIVELLGHTLPPTILRKHPSLDIPGVCAECGVDYLKHRSNQRYCSHECKYAVDARRIADLHRSRKRERLQS